MNENEVARTDAAGQASGEQKAGSGERGAGSEQGKKRKLPFTSKSGAYIEAGPREYKLYANFGREALVAVLEVDTDCPGRVYTYFMRGGIVDSKMTVAEFRQGVSALNELLETALELWPGKMRAET